MGGVRSSATAASDDDDDLDDDVAREAMAVATAILDHPDDPEVLAAGRRFLAAHPAAVARTRAWRAERAAAPVDPATQALIDREIADICAELGVPYVPTAASKSVIR